MNRKHLINELLEAKSELTQLIEKLEAHPRAFFKAQERVIVLERDHQAAHRSIAEKSIIKKYIFRY